MSKKKAKPEGEGHQEKEKRKIDKWRKKHPNCGMKSCLRCGKEFMSTDVCRNRICLFCSRSSSKDWYPNVYKSGLNMEPDDCSM